MEQLRADDGNREDKVKIFISEDLTNTDSNGTLLQHTTNKKKTVFSKTLSRVMVE